MQQGWLAWVLDLHCDEAGAGLVRVAGWRTRVLEQPVGSVQLAAGSPGLSPSLGWCVACAVRGLTLLYQLSPLGS